jgi:hypothetical protein
MKYDAQRNVALKKCIKIYDFETLFKDLKQCEDYDKNTITGILMRKVNGKGINPDQLIPFL